MVSIAFQEESYTTSENTPAVVCVDIVEGTIDRSVEFDISFSSLTASRRCHKKYDRQDKFVYVRFYITFLHTQLLMTILKEI